MPNPFASAIAAAHGTLLQAAGVEVSYIRAGGATIPLSAVPGRTDIFTISPSFDQVRSQSADWVFVTTSLLDAGALFLPARGDQIVIDVEAENRRLTFEVASPQGDDLYRFTDSSRAGIRVFTNLIKSEPIPA